MKAVHSGANEMPARGGGRDRLRRVLRLTKPLIVAMLFVLALRALAHVLAGYQWGDLLRYLSVLPAGQIAAAVLLTAAGYLTMTGYDTLAFRHIRQSLPYRSIAFVSFTGYAINNNLGLSGVVGTSWRYRFYSQKGVQAGHIARVFLFSTVSYWLGFLVLGGGVFLLQPPAIPSATHLPMASIRAFGVLLLMPGVAYFSWAAIRRQPIRLGRWHFELPKPSVSAVPVLISMADWTIAAAALYALLPGPVPVSFIHILGVFLLAQVGGLVSNVPGGLGVFETIALMLLVPTVPASECFGALVAFRGIYFLLPLLVALVLLTWRLAMHKREMP